MRMPSSQSRGLALGALLSLAALAGVGGFVAIRRAKRPAVPAPVPTVASQTGRAEAVPSDTTAAEATGEDAPSIAKPNPAASDGALPPRMEATPSTTETWLAMTDPKVAAASDGGLLIAGFPSDGRAVAAKLDPDGTAQWGEAGHGIGLNGVASIACLEPSEDGGCFLAGTWSAHGDAPEDQILFLARFDARGNALWHANGLPGLRIGDPGEYTAQHLCPLPDGGCAVLGLARERDGSHAWLLRVGPDGASVWREGTRPGRTFSNGGNERMFKAAPLPDGGLVVIGQAGSEPAGLFRAPHGQALQARPQAPPFNLLPATGDAWFLVLDASGASRLDSPGFGAGRRFTGTHFADVAVDASGQVWFAGCAWISDNAGSAGFLTAFSWNDVAGGRMDRAYGSGKAILGDTFVLAEGGGGFTHVIPLPDGGCLLTGRGCPRGAKELQTWVVRLNPDATSTWRDGSASGRFLPDDGCATPVLLTQDGHGAWFLSPRSAGPAKPFHLVRVTSEEGPGWFGDPIDSAQAVTLAAPGKDRQGGPAIQGFGAGGRWAVVLDEHGRRH